MARLSRVVSENIPHHIVQRGNRGQQVFFSEDDKRTYLNIIRNGAKKHGVCIWAYCLMDNHVHFICVPETAQSLSRFFQEVNKTYTRKINFREGWRGGMWEGRFKSFPMDERYLHAAVKYVERNPVRAGMVANAEDYPFSSARAHVNKLEDTLLTTFYMLEKIPNWKSYLDDADEEADVIEKHLSTGRPLGEESFVNRLEMDLKRVLKAQKPGRKPKSGDRSPISLLF